MSDRSSKFLSKAGKVVLIKAVVQTIRTYSMYVFRLPKGVCKSFRTKVARYWWGKGDGKKGIHWCKWEVLCKHKNEGELGFRNLEGFNKALLAKTVWRIVFPIPFILSSSSPPRKIFPSLYLRWYRTRLSPLFDLEKSCLGEGITWQWFKMENSKWCVSICLGR